MHGLAGIILLFFMYTQCNASWGSPGQGQYHIQTDEGPERYFRYQTDNGQYRKEKRLQDGTVIGTEAWIDAAGYLRHKDYIADDKGYRILKSKTVYVGNDKPIEEAIKSLKNQPAQSGTLVPHRTPTHRHQSHASRRPATTTSKPVLIYSKTTTTTLAPPTSTYIPQIDPNAIAPSPYLGYDHYPTPQVDVHHHSQPIDDNYLEAPENNYHPSSTPPPPSIEFEPPYEDFRKVRPIAVINTTPAPIAIDYNVPPIPFGLLPTSTPLPFEYSSPSPFSPQSTTPLPIGDGYSYNPSTSGPVESTTQRPIVPFDGNHLNEPRPLYNRGSRPRPYRYREPQQPLSYDNNLESGYEPPYPEYDGVGVTRNGFRYYLPRQYHEEENINSRRRAGSFGYIDPFGIRRVVYYNASPENGFVHRKNNRYVGFNATPYDPRPL